MVNGGTTIRRAWQAFRTWLGLASRAGVEDEATKLEDRLPGAATYCCGACEHVALAAQGKVTYASSPPLLVGAGGAKTVLVIRNRVGAPRDRVALARSTRLTIGSRGGGCDIQIDDPALSRRTCAIEIADTGDAFVADLESACGTVVNGRKVVRCGLHEQDIIEVGFSMLTFERG